MKLYYTNFHQSLCCILLMVSTFMWPNPVSIVPFVPLRNRKQNSAVYGSEETGGTGE
jgi:hypothetical protein